MQFRTLHAAVLALSLVFASRAAAAEIWREVDLGPAAARAAETYDRYFEADLAALHIALTDTGIAAGARGERLLRLPLPDGSLPAYSVTESEVMEPELAMRYPDIRTFRVRGVDDQEAAGGLSLTPLGLHGLIYTSKGRVYISPADFRAGDGVYRTRYTAGEKTRRFSCGTLAPDVDARDVEFTGARLANRREGKLLRYKIAIAATNEYHAYFGNDVANTTAAITATLMAVNTAYERDLGITLRLVGNNDLLYETTDFGVLNNNSVEDLLDDAGTWIDSLLPGGDDKYDIGHMFSTGSDGGVARLGVVCNNTFKADGVSGAADPLGSAFDIDYVAHEIGHQFNARHSFNGTTRACKGARSAGSAFEPGSGSSIMAYAGICGAENLQDNSDAVFHARSMSQIDNFTSKSASCYRRIDTSPAGNDDPVVDPVANSSIPANTPFLLDVSATDAQTLSYQWDQLDKGCPTDSSSFGTDNGSNPLFRSRLPRPESWRNFPALGTQLRDLYDAAEVLPCQDRELSFKVTVRDGVSGQGSRGAKLSVVASAGPFEITSQTTAGDFFANTPTLVTWDVAGTDSAPISCANVDIDLLTFSSSTYTSYSVHPILASTPNDGNEMVTILPAGTNHPRARLRVKCSDNVFYALSDADLAIVENGVAADIPLDDDDNFTRITGNPSLLSSTVPSCPAVADCSVDKNVDNAGGSRNGDASAVDFRWLVVLLVLAGIARLRRGYGLQ